MAITKIPAAGFTGNNFRNIIINGDMSIAQRGTSTSGIAGSFGYFTVDRWRVGVNNLGTWTMSQDTDVPTGQGFATSMKFDCTTADASPAAGDAFILNQYVEGQNLQYLKKGTANAQSLTCSFWVKSNKTGTYILELRDDNNRTISKSYTIDASNTWEKKTITYDGDTTGTIDNDNTTGLEVNFWLGAGSTYTSGTLQTSWDSVTNANRAVGQVNLADNTANEWYITGVQLEAGTTASDFEFLPVDVNENRCLRYYQVLAEGDNKIFGNGFYYNSTTVFSSQKTLKTMRAIPSIDQVSGTNYYEFLRNGSPDGFNSLNLSGTYTSTKYLEFSVTSNVSGTGGQAGWFRTANASSYVAVDAEL